MKMRIVLLALISFCFLSVNAADKKKNQPVNDRTHSNNKIRNEL